METTATGWGGVPSLLLCLFCAPGTHLNSQSECFLSYSTCRIGQKPLTSMEQFTPHWPEILSDSPDKPRPLTADPQPAVKEPLAFCYLKSSVRQWTQTQTAPHVHKPKKDRRQLQLKLLKSAFVPTETEKWVSASNLTTHMQVSWLVSSHWRQQNTKSHTLSNSEPKTCRYCLPLISTATSFTVYLVSFIGELLPSSAAFVRVWLTHTHTHTHTHTQTHTQT